MPKVVVVYGSELEDIRKELEWEEKARRLLGVRRDATHHEIKRAYWLRAMECHPDRVEGGDPERFMMLSEAYEYLTTRRNNDRYSFHTREVKEREDYVSWWRKQFFE
ncbi:MAG TPA: J domain-containing protein [Methermicoccus shengliensis]|uniref:J domain-containing protein n=1 Tax=Methermicoccus shengliensis TaxID=660064 RepID=A0A832RTJ1_9EURY|nr:J domain-containing protein [Methermicoccus shengliensis]